MQYPDTAPFTRGLFMCTDRGFRGVVNSVNGDLIILWNTYYASYLSQVFLYIFLCFTRRTLAFNLFVFYMIYKQYYTASFISLEMQRLYALPYIRINVKLLAQKCVEYPEDNFPSFLKVMRVDKPPLPPQMAHISCPYRKCTWFVIKP